MEEVAFNDELVGSEDVKLVGSEEDVFDDELDVRAEVVEFDSKTVEGTVDELAEMPEEVVLDETADVELVLGAEEVVLDESPVEGVLSAEDAIEEETEETWQIREYVVVVVHDALLLVNATARYSVDKVSPATQLGVERTNPEGGP